MLSQSNAAEDWGAAAHLLDVHSDVFECSNYHIDIDDCGQMNFFMSYKSGQFQEKEVIITKASGETKVTTVRVWNETVSNLTLMALGSSAPEILLSVIEVWRLLHF